MDETKNELQEVEIGKEVTGTVVKVEDKQVLVDINYKSEAIVPISELSSLQIEHPNDVVSEGDEVILEVIKIDENDEVICSKKAVDAKKAWSDLEEKFENEEVFETEVKEIVKGGLVVDVGVRGFIPASLVETYFVEDFSEYLNETLPVKVIELDQSQNRVILSHRAVKEEEEAKERAKLLRSEEHTSELQSRGHLVCRLLLEKKNIVITSLFVSIRLTLENDQTITYK